MKNRNVIQWFIQLFCKDMKAYQEDEKVKMEIYKSVRKKQGGEGRGEKHGLS